ncbi:MAG: DUF1929 domain-containing protein [Acidobacteria bacterium]|nr:DUF1929 domain-containing protein [Acidobacteriota bacterium]
MEKGLADSKILFHARFPQYVSNDVADPALIDMAIERGAFTTDGRQFDSSLRDVLHGFDPFLGLGMNRTPDDSFQRLTYGGYLMRQGLSLSVPTRIVANRTMERQLLFDIGRPHAFKNRGKFHTALLDEQDFALNRAAFEENGYSKGMFYNTYCNARVTLSDGRVYVFGGHDMQSDNGLYKVNIFDPDTEAWVRRSEPCDRANWTADPFGRLLFAGNPPAPFYGNCDPRNQQSTQPSDPSDQEYARWYPSAAALPNDQVLVLGGFDQDGTVAPDPARAEKGRANQSQSDPAFTASRVNIVVPEVYDPVTDRNISLENARMAFPLYPQMEVVQTGPGKDDWRVCTFNGEINYGTIESEDAPGTPAYRNAQGQRQKGGARFGVGGGTPPFINGTTWCLNVVAAMSDPNRDVPAKNHWTLLDTASEVRPYCCPSASLIELDVNGDTLSHKWFMISGQRPIGATGTTPTGTIEVIDFADPSPRWRPAGQLLTALTTTKAVVLPDGKVLVGHGVNRALPTYEQREGLRFQIYDPGTETTTALGLTTVSRGLHGTATLLPNATVFFAGENREALVRSDDPSFPMTTSYAGEVPRGDPDLGVPVGQVLSPPYLFQRGGGRSSRPKIVHAPGRLSYGGRFDLRVAGRGEEVGSVVLLRSDHNTHSLTTGDRHMKLGFTTKGRAAGDLQVTLPKHQGQAVPGVYMLFVVDKRGVPSVGYRVDLKP